MMNEQMMYKPANLNQHNTTFATPTQHTHNTSDESALILIGVNNQLLTINSQATRLLGVSADTIKGQPIAILGEALSAIAKEPTKPGTSNLLTLANGKTVLATTRNVVGHNQQPMGRVITLQTINTVMHDIKSTSLSASYTTTPVVDNLQAQIKTMQDLIAMVPRFSNNRFWQNLLVEHMQKLVYDMTQQIQRLTPVAPSA
jgi:hypothetical protein